MLKLQELIIDKKSIGSKCILVSVRPSYIYVDGQRSNEISGYNYDIVLPDKQFEHINIKISGDKQIDFEDYDAPTEVIFGGLELGISWRNGSYYVTGTASTIQAKSKDTVN